MPTWLIDAFVKGGPYALCVPLAGTVIILWQEITKLREQLTVAHKEHAADTAARQERHAAALAQLHEKHAAELASQNARHDTAVHGMTEARIEEMGRVTTAVLSLAQTAQVLDRLSERSLPAALPHTMERQGSKPRLPRAGGEG